MKNISIKPFNAIPQSNQLVYQFRVRLIGPTNLSSFW